MLPTRLRYANSRLLEIQNGCSAILLGVILLLPYETFSQAAWYQVLAAWAREETWGGIFLLLGLLQVGMAAIDSFILRRIAASTLAMLYLVFLSAVLEWNPYSIWGGLLAPIVVGQILAFYQMRKMSYVRPAHELD